MDKSSRILSDMNEIRASLPALEELRDATVLVTGTYGMLASYLVRFLIHLNETEPDRNLRIVALGRSKAKCLARFGAFAKKDYFVFLEGDVTAPISCDGPVDYVIHAASHATPRSYGTDPVGTMLPNLLGTYHTLELAKEKKVKGYLFFSSGEVYGKPATAAVSEHDFGISDPTLLRSTYGESKRAGETLCVSYAAQYGVPAKIVRPSHTFGPTMDPAHDGRVFADFVRHAVSGTDIVMRSDGTATRCFIYLTDATAAYLRVLLFGKAGEAYNVSHPKGQYAIAELAALLSDLAGECFGTTISVTRGEKDQGVLERGEAVYERMNVGKLEALGWQARVSVEEGFRRTLLHFKEAEQRKGTA